MKVLTEGPLARHTLVRMFGLPDADLHLGTLRRLASASRNRWPWMRVFSTDELVLVAVTELAVMPENGAEYAWRQAAAWAYQMADLDPGTMLPRTRPLDEQDDRPITLTVGPDEMAHLNLDSLRPEVAEVVAMSLSGMGWAEMGRMLGRHPNSLAQSYRRGVNLLICTNPWLIARFALTPCPDHRAAASWCRTCKGFGWTYHDGQPLNQEAHR